MKRKDIQKGPETKEATDNGVMDLTTVIEVRDLSKTYGDVQAVKNVNLSVEKGALFGLLGPNGSGKTTMIKMLTGQTRPTGGSATVLGVDTVKDPVGVRRKVGIIPEQETPPSFLTAMEYLEFVAAIRKIPDIETKADWWFDFLDFADKKNVLCKDLSRGTRQKLMFTQAFLHEPELALIDEPLINFDPIMQDIVKDYLAGYVKKGRTIFISTHILEVAEEICSGFAILHKGILLHTGPVAELTARDEHLPSFFLSLIRKDRHV
jgi:ABC-2 type transport system ATP-binding protein